MEQEPNQAPVEYVEALRKKGFEVGNLLGSGAYGRVYEAKQKSLDRSVAVKFAENPNGGSASNVKRAKREPHLLALVEHPAVPYVITTGTAVRDEKEIPYTVMQFIPGQTLEKLLARGKIDEATVLRVMRAILSALQCIHARDIVHRDVKPGNIMVSAHSTHLLDFSIGVSLAAPAPGLTRTTKLAERVGTHDYAAPEQMKDSSSVDHRADLYSAAVVLAELLGARPRLRIAQLDDELKNVSAKLRDVVRRGASEALESRFQNAQEFLQAFDEAVGSGHGAIYAESIVLCPNLKCGLRVRSNGGKYYWGPMVGLSADQYCSCGTALIRSCHKCNRPLPPDVSDRVTKQTKSARDAFEDHCRKCGTLIFRNPICECQSYLSLEDVDSGQTRCKKCRTGLRGPVSPRDTEGDIPF